jgi:TolC family type I secretion outer membrane protein
MNKHFPRLALTSSLLALAAAFAAEGARAESLADVVAYAYQTNPGLQQQRAALKALDENYVQARGGFGPNVSGSTNVQSEDEHLKPPPSPLTPSHQYANTASGTLTIQQPIYTGGKATSRLTEAEAQILGGREELRRFEIDLLQRVVAAYTSVRRDQQLLKVSQDTVAVLERELSDTESRFKVRDVTATDVAQAKARLAGAQTQLADAHAALNVSRAQFAGVVGENPTDLDEPPPLDVGLTTIDQAFDAAERNNPQLLSAEYTEQSSRARVSEAKAQVLPSVTASYSLYHTPYLPYSSANYNTAQQLTLTLSQPIFASGQIMSTIRQSVDQNERDRLGIDDARRQVIVTVSEAWEQLADNRTQLKTLNEAVKANEFAFYGVREEQKSALRTTLDVLNAELELSQAQQQLVRTQANEYLARVQLLGVVGVLTPTLLSPNVPLYDPAANFRKVKDIGQTPMEWPVRALDGLGQPSVKRPPPASVAEVTPAGAAMPPTPGPADPIQSILSTIGTAPPQPK